MGKVNARSVVGLAFHSRLGNWLSINKSERITKGKLTCGSSLLQKWLSTVGHSSEESRTCPPGQAEAVCLWSWPDAPGQPAGHSALARCSEGQAGGPHAGTPLSLNTMVDCPGPRPLCRPHHKHGGKGQAPSLCLTRVGRGEGCMTAPLGVLSSSEGHSPSWLPPGSPQTVLRAARGCTKALTVPCLCGLR